MKRKNNSAGYKGYVPVYIDDDTKKAIKAKLGTPKDLLLRLEKYLEDGYKFTLSWDDYNSCISASLFDTDSKRPTGGYILSAKHVDMVVALTTLVHLHEIVYPDGWDVERANTGNQVSW